MHVEDYIAGLASSVADLSTCDRVVKKLLPDWEWSKTPEGEILLHPPHDPDGLKRTSSLVPDDLSAAFLAALLRALAQVIEKGRLGDVG